MTVIKEKILKNICAAVIAVLFSFILLLLGRGLVGNLIGVNENFYLKYYYDIVNSNGADGRVFTVPDSITIINLQKYRNRKDIATILDKVYSYNPRVIGLDVYFQDNPDIQEDVNGELVKVLYRVQDKLVVPCNYWSDDGGTVYTTYPFFHRMDGLDKITYVSPLAHDFYGYYAFDDGSVVNKESEAPVLQRMGIEIARRSGMSLYDYSGNYYINYSKKNLAQIIIDDTLGIRKSTIEDNIVLIGDMSDIKDMVRLPFLFGDKKEISGIEDIAYTVLSIRKNAQLPVGERSRFIGFQDWPKWLSLLLSFIITLLFCFIHNWYGTVKVKTLNKGKFSAICSILLQPFLFILIEICVVASCYLITFLTNTIPDLFVSMVSIALVGISIELTNSLFSRR